MALITCVKGNLLSARAALTNAPAGSVEFHAGITMLEKAINDLKQIANQLLLKAKRLAATQEKLIKDLHVKCEIFILTLTLQFPCIASRVPNV